MHSGISVSAPQPNLSKFSIISDPRFDGRDTGCQWSTFNQQFLQSTQVTRRLWQLPQHIIVIHCHQYQPTTLSDAFAKGKGEQIWSVLYASGLLIISDNLGRIQLYIAANKVKFVSKVSIQIDL
jgi:hypothetical protein